MWPFKKNKIESINADVVQFVGEIGRMKQELPFSQRSWCNQLGLFVQLREFNGFGKLEAGKKTKAFLKANRDSPFDEWEVKHYVNGDWESLADPTYELARWIISQGGVTEDNVNIYDQMIEEFHRTGTLPAP
jgi:hypothetical protein